MGPHQYTRLLCGCKRWRVGKRGGGIKEEEEEEGGGGGGEVRNKLPRNFTRVLRNSGVVHPSVNSTRVSPIRCLCLPTRQQPINFNHSSSSSFFTSSSSNPIQVHSNNIAAISINWNENTNSSNYYFNYYFNCYSFIRFSLTNWLAISTVDTISLNDSSHLNWFITELIEYESSEPIIEIIFKWFQLWMHVRDAMKLELESN